MSDRLRCRWTRSATAIVVAASCLAAGTPARGDDDEIERRLKIAGVAEDVRARIRGAIDAGVRYLLSRQSKDGAFRDVQADGSNPTLIDGHTAIASLALAHSGGRAARAGAELGLSYLVVDGEPRAAVMGFTYDAGLTAMLLAALHAEAPAARRIGWAVSVGLNPRCDWWGYAVGRATAQEPSIDEKPDDENLSTTQFAALGLWSAGRAGGVEYPRTWRRHLASLWALQTENGSWPYWASGQRENGKRGYPNGTCMGLANLTLARAALEEDLADDPVLAARAELAHRRGLEALQRDGPSILDLGAAQGSIDYYGYYALEKACVFAGLERVGGRAWYLAGAGRLLAAQGKSGGWSSMPSGVLGVPWTRKYDDVVSTSFALLFLLRASETYRPDTPRDVEPRGPETPGGEARRAAPSEPAPPETIGPDRADAVLDRLAPLARDPRATASDLLRALDDVERAQRGLGAAAAPQWRDREERLLLDVFKEALDGAASRRDADVAIRAAAILGGTRPVVASAMRSALGDALRPDDSRPPPRALLGAAFGALARLGGEATFDWLVRRITDSTRPADVRTTRAALGALARFDGAGGADRLQAVSRIVRVLEPIEQAAAPGAESDEYRSLVARNLMGSLGAAALTALEHLSADARTGGPATAADGAPLLTVAAYGRWLAKHRDVAAPPWN